MYRPRISKSQTPSVRCLHRKTEDSKPKPIKNNKDQLHFAQSLSSQYSGLLGSVTNIKYPDSNLQQKKEARSNKLRHQCKKLVELNRVMKDQLTLSELHKEESGTLQAFLRNAGIRNIDNFISQYEENQFQAIKLKEQYDEIDKKVIEERSRKFLSKKIDEGNVAWEQCRDLRLAAECKSDKLKEELAKAEKEFKKVNSSIIDCEIKMRHIEKDHSHCLRQKKERKLKLKS